MAKHEIESTYISMDNTRISEKTFSVPLGIGGYLLTIAEGLMVYMASNNSSSCTVSYTALRKKTDMHFHPTLL